jgi:transcriptional regulator with XRE-family HTH domain
MPADIVTSRDIGAAIRKRRKELGLSQEQLAEKVGVSYQQIQRYENGNSMLNVENMQRIAKILYLPVTSLFAPDQAHAVAEAAFPYAPSDEKTLLRYYREISSRSDKHLAISLVRRLATK